MTTHPKRSRPLTRSRRQGFRPEILGLEERTMMASGLAAASAEAARSAVAGRDVHYPGRSGDPRRRAAAPRVARRPTQPRDQAGHLTREGALRAHPADAPGPGRSRPESHGGSAEPRADAGRVAGAGRRQCRLAARTSLGRSSRSWPSRSTSTTKAPPTPASSRRRRWICSIGPHRRKSWPRPSPP